MDIAIIGMSCRFPGANNVEEFWTNIINGRNSVTLTPKSRHYYMGKDATGGFLASPLDQFDYGFFHISPKEANSIDPQQRLFLEVTWECMEDAGILPTSLNGSKTGVFLGISENIYRSFIDPYSDKLGVGNSFSGATGRLSYFLNLKGPSVPIEATCASSALAIHQACLSLRDGECTMAFAGGVNIFIHAAQYPEVLTSESSKSFDARANGFAPAEGCGVVLLKPYNMAVRDGNRIHGIIRGSATNASGTTSSYGTPSVSAEEDVIRQGLARAGINPNDVNYIEAHVGGTIVGDGVEMMAITNVFSSSGKQLSRNEPLIIGSVKPNIGHAMAASGIASLIKILLCFKYYQIPRQINLDELHPDINLSLIPGIITKINLPWNSTGDKPRIGVFNGFGFTGNNVHVVLEEPRKLENDQSSCGKSLRETDVLLTISAKTSASLQAIVSEYQKVLKQSDFKINLSDFAFTANCHRAQHNYGYHVAVLVNSVEDAAEKLNYLEATKPQHKVPLVFMFTGNGCEYPGMAMSLYETCPWFQTTFNKCNVLYKEYTGGVSLRDVIMGQVTGYSWQPVIFCIEYCLYDLWTTGIGLKPDFVVGHSVGEFAASVAAGILAFEDAFKLVCARSQLIETKVKEGIMLAINTNNTKVSSMIQDFQANNSECWLDISCINSIDQTVVSTLHSTGLKFQEYCVGLGYNVKIVSNHKHPIGYHSRLMEPVLDKYEELIKTINFNRSYPNPNSPRYVSSLIGEILVDPQATIDLKYWRNHTRSPVQFTKAIDAIINANRSSDKVIFLEVSPHPILSTFVLNTFGNDADSKSLVVSPSLKKSKCDDWHQILETLGIIYNNSNIGGDINFQLIHNCNGTSGKFNDIPKYQFSRKKCWPSGKVVQRKNARGEKEKYHSLLGPVVDSSTLHFPLGGNEIRFSNSLSSTQSNHFLHYNIAGQVIFPLSGYIEMLLAVAEYVKESNDTKVVVENLEILSDFVLEEDTTTETHTRVEYIKGNPLVRVTFYTKKLGRDIVDWIERARGTINLSSLEQLNFATNPLISCSNSTKMEKLEVYQKLQSFGQEVEVLDQNIKEMVFKLNKPESLTTIIFSDENTEVKQETFTCHPLILDVILTAAMLHFHNYYNKYGANSDILLLPIFIKKFYWLKDPSNLIKHCFYFHIQENTEIGILYEKTEFGNMVPLALLETKNCFVEKSRVNFLNSLAASEDGNQLPQFVKKTFVPFDISKNEDKPNQDEKTWVIFSPTRHPEKTEQSIINGLERCGKRTFRVISTKPNEDQPCLSKEEIYFDPNSSGNKYKELGATLQGQNHNNIESIVYMWGFPWLHSSIASGSDLQLTCKKYFNSFLSTLKMNILSTIEATVILITSKSLTSNPEQATLWGLLDTYTNEYKNLIGFGIDIENIDTCENIVDILLDLPIEKGVYFGPKGEITVVKYQHFNPNIPIKHRRTIYKKGYTYLITGGFGGISFGLGKRIIAEGAKVLLVGRSELNPSKKVELEALGPLIKYVQCDVGEYDSCQMLLKDIPQFDGIFHCAAELSNHILIHQTAETISTCFQAKVYGTWNLHTLTLERETPLSYFVVFSSVASVIGSPGMCNYVAANRYIDTLMEYRANHCKIPGLSINWGCWAEFGLSADLNSDYIMYFPHFTAKQGFESMELSMKLELSGIMISNVDPNITKAVPSARSMFSDLEFYIPPKSKCLSAHLRPWKAVVKKVSGNSILNRGKAVHDAKEKDTREVKIEELLEEIFKLHSGLDQVDRLQPLTDLEMDSLLSIAMRANIFEQLKIPIPSIAMYEYITISKLSKYINGIWAEPSRDSLKTEG